MMDPIFESLYTEELYTPAPKVTVVIATPWNKITEEERQLLTKILGAIKLSLEGIRIIEQAQFNLGTLIEKPRKLICFSPAPKALNKYEVINAEDTALVLSDSLTDLWKDDAAKRMLWLALKQLFSV